MGDFAEKMFVLTGIYMLVITIFVSIAAGVLVEHKASMLAESVPMIDSAATFAVNDGFTYAQGNSTETTIMEPKMSLTWLGAMKDILLSSSLEFSSDSSFLTANAYILRVMFWLPLIIFVVCGFIVIFG